jgi:pimeloyl-ACP methyl ester carboxylesterase
MAQRLAASYVEFPGAGHSPAVEVPELVAAALEEFWSLT